MSDKIRSWPGSLGALLRVETHHSRPVVTLFRSIAISAIVSTAFGAIALVSQSGLGRLREVGIFWLLRRGHVDLGFDFPFLGPSVLNGQYELAGWGDLLEFFFPAIMFALLVAFGVGVVLIPVVLLAAKWLKISNPRWEWFWGKAYPLGILVGFSLPEFVRASDHVLGPNIWGARRLLLVLAANLICYLAVLGFFSRRSRVRGLLRFGTICSAIIVVGSFVPYAVTGLLAQPDRGPLAPLEGERRPNIILVSIDSLRADHLHGYGYRRETSPTIDGLAREGVLFETVLSPTSWTLPAHITLLSALAPEDHGVNDDGMKLGPDAVLLSEVLQDAGYATAGFVAGHYLDASYGFFQGFDLYDDYGIISDPRESERLVTSPRLLKFSREWLQKWDEEGRRKPFFLFLHMWDVHIDYIPPPPYDTLFDPDYRGLVTGEDVWDDATLNKNMDPRDLEHLVALYDGEIRYTDLHLGKILNVLKELGVYDQTIIVVTSDHGEEFFEHGWKVHKFTLYEEVLRVPLVVRYPAKIPAGAVVAQQVRLMDVAPTILSLAGIPQPENFGTSALRDPHAERDLYPLIVGDEAEATPPSIAFGDLQGKIASIRTEKHKLILNEQGLDELYDLSIDPQEQSNVLRSHVDIYEALRRVHLVWKSTRARKTGFSKPAKLSVEQLEVLRSLGYVE